MVAAVRASQVRILTAWVSVKTRWRLTVDAAELGVLESLAASCPNVPITVQVA